MHAPFYHLMNQCHLMKTIHHYHKCSRNNRMTSAPPMNVPTLLPILAKTTTSRIRVTLFPQNPFTLYTSSDRLSKSDTCGRFTKAWTIPANQPAAISGLSDVIGAAINAVNTANGWPNATNVPIADKLPFHSIQLTVCCHPAEGFEKNVYTITAIIIIGIDQPMIFGTLDFFGRSSKRSKSCDA